jgi:ribonucleoside-diphosphate reductase alpha chain
MQQTPGTSSVALGHPTDLALEMGYEGSRVEQQRICVDIWNSKYRFNGEDDPRATKYRVANGIYANDPEFLDNGFACMDSNLWVPAGRILAGAGTPKRVTLINCYVNERMSDSMEGIMSALTNAALTQQQGGGIGTGFSSLRPRGAKVKRTMSVSSGVIPFMGMWDSMCRTIRSSGSRRGAMMATLHIDHPDVIEFIHAKESKGVLENFNMSVLVSDAFMEAVAQDDDWDLGFEVEPAEFDPVTVKERDGKPWYVYKRMKARELWGDLQRTTFEFSEPGVIFIDHVNDWNNLGYCEYIDVTNPCGEQPLPPHGDCNLGAVNLAKIVNDPFTKHAEIDFDNLKFATSVGQRFLDNVIDVSLYPLALQKEEALEKRRTGLGITGLANMLQFLQVRYGSDQSLTVIEKVMKTMRDECYRTSVGLAQERGVFPAFDKDKYLERPFIKKLPKAIRESIAEHGIRNGVLMTIAPTGTTSIFADNVSSGIEPTFAWRHRRKVRQDDGESWVEYDVEDYGYQMFREVKGEPQVDGDGMPINLPSFMVTAPELAVREHLLVQAAAQKFVDSSISKTINCPQSMTFDEFQDVYQQAYDLGCKGCTTYRPSAVRGSILSLKKKPEIVVPARPKELIGTTYKVKYDMQNFYVTLNDFVDENGVMRPFEIFINTKSIRHQEWITALTRTISAVFRRGGEIVFLIEELEQVFSPTGGAWVEGRFVPSLVAQLGIVLRRHLEKLGMVEPKETVESNESMEICPQCNQKTLTSQEGCDKCLSCGHATCG